MDRQSASRPGRRSPNLPPGPPADWLLSNVFAIPAPRWSYASLRPPQEDILSDDWLAPSATRPFRDIRREKCPEVHSCGNATVYRVFVVIDGVLPGIGALSFASAHLLPGTTPQRRGPRTQVRIVPQFGGPYGVNAIGTF